MFSPRTVAFFRLMPSELSVRSASAGRLDLRESEMNFSQCLREYGMPLSSLSPTCTKSLRSDSRSCHTLTSYCTPSSRLSKVMMRWRMDDWYCALPWFFSRCSRQISSSSSSFSSWMKWLYTRE